MRGGVERYQFTWPDKKKSVVLANQPINKTLRLDRDKSVGRDGTPGSIDTENIYIEGDNLDALKLLQETYLGKVKMIYIDPPYNTGNDFIYEDNFSEDVDEYANNSGQIDDLGNRLVQNTENNGRFHTDWLNMIYPRLRIAKDLLSEDGVIFISIDEHEVNNLQKVCNEVFGERNYAATFLWTKTSTPPALSYKCRKTVEYVLAYEKNLGPIKYYGAPLDGGDAPLLNSGNPIKTLLFPSGSIYFNFIESGVIQPEMKDRVELLDELHIEAGRNVNAVRFKGEFKWEQNTLNEEVLNGTYFVIKTDKFSIRFQRSKQENSFKTPTNFINIELNKDSGVGTNETAVKDLSELDLGKCFDYSKPYSLIETIANMVCKYEKNSIMLDFFSGSGTLAQAVMNMNAKDGGFRKFILVQIPEECPKDSEAYKAGYKTICDVGEERIRRAGKKIKEDNPDANVDIGFRVFKVDSSNMKDVYYKPDGYDQGQIDLFTDNIKEDRTPEDLLFQVMLDLGISLSSKIEESVINDKKVFVVGGEYTTLDGSSRTHLIACFDKDITDDTVKAIAEKHPSYAVFRDSCMANDSVATNFEQIFETYSPDTVRKVL